MEWNEYISYLLSSDNNFENLSISLDEGRTITEIPPIIQTSITMLDKMIEKSKDLQFQMIEFDEAGDFGIEVAAVDEGPFGGTCAHIALHGLAVLAAAGVEDGPEVVDLRIFGAGPEHVERRGVVVQGA